MEVRGEVLYVIVLGSARTGLIFTGLQEGAQLGGLTQPNLAKQSRVFHTMCRHAGFWWGGAAGRELTRAREHSAAVWSERAVRPERAVLFCWFVLCIPLICIVVVPVPSVCCSVKLRLSRPTVFCLFLPILLRTPAGGGAAAWCFCCRLQRNQNSHQIINQITKSQMNNHWYIKLRENTVLNSSPRTRIHH